MGDFEGFPYIAWVGNLTMCNSRNHEGMNGVTYIYIYILYYIYITSYFVGYLEGEG